MMRILCILVLCTVCVACDDDTTACGNRDPELCEQDAACSVIGGREAGDDFEGTVDDDIPLGCQSRDTVCGDAETCAYDGENGPAYRFRTTCIPLGWVMLDDTECDDGASSADAGVDCVKGEYGSFFVAIAGNCGPISTSFEVSLGETGVRTTTEMFASSDVTTMTVVKGCSARVVRTVAAKTGQVTEQIDAPVLQSDGEGSLVGEASRVRFDDQSQVLCEGTYEMTLVPMPPLP